MKSFSLKSRPGDNGAELITRTEMDYESAKKRYNIIIRASSLPLRNDVDVEIHVTGNEYKFFSVSITLTKAFLPTLIILNSIAIIQTINNSNKLIKEYRSRLI